MSHPLYDPCKIFAFDYVYCIRVIAHNIYWDIRLEETKSTKEWVKAHIWETDIDTLKVKVLPDDEYVIIMFPDNNHRILPIFTGANPIYRTHKDIIKNIKQRKEEQKNIAEFHKFLKEIGIRFEIDFNQYKEDSDYMKVFFKGQKIHQGTTEHLQFPK